MCRGRAALAMSVEGYKKSRILEGEVISCARGSESLGRCEQTSFSLNQCIQYHTLSQKGTGVYGV